jgi:glutamate dehydrogenase/leucine dehydrogenase
MAFKWLTVPWSNETKQIQVMQTWEVRWQSRNGEYSGNVKPEAEVFTSEEEAVEFANSLKKAFRLIRHTSGTSVSISKSRSR